MQSALKIDIEWRNNDSIQQNIDQDEEFATEGSLEILANNVCLTQNVSDWLSSCVNGTMISAKPFSEWICGSWWRLLYEPMPSIMGEPSVKWRMAHDMTSIGSGYAWPVIRFSADGELVYITSQQQNDQNKFTQPILYIGAPRQRISLKDTESSFSSFVENTIERLVGLEKYSSSLAELWKTIKGEKSQPETALYRKIEALIGFDPDEASKDLMQHFSKMLERMPEHTVLEIASACSINEEGKSDESVSEFCSMMKKGVEGRIEKFSVNIHRDSFHTPWEYGSVLAGKLRSELDFNKPRLETSNLCDLFSITQKQLRDTPPAGNYFSLSIKKNQVVNINFAKDSIAYTAGRRFQLARLLGAIVSENDSLDKTYIPITACKTWKQKVQRAFATEFLCPIKDLMKFIKDRNRGRVTQNIVDSAAKYFIVSPRTVIHNLRNNREITYDDAVQLQY
jgi:hypothetical protein